jgi:hypothetical protein
VPCSSIQKRANLGAAVPIAACFILAVSSGSAASWLLSSCAAAALIAGAVVAADHAEVKAHGVGEPFGTLVLAMSLTGSSASACWWGACGTPVAALVPSAAAKPRPMNS